MVLLCITMGWLLSQWVQSICFVREELHGKRRATNKNTHYYYLAKPAWVKREVIKLKALMPDCGCRGIAHAFNRLHQHKGMTIGKSYAYEVIKRHAYEIQVARRKIKHKRPRPLPHNRVWAIDLTGKTDSAGTMHSILGIVEHRSRACLSLSALSDKASITLLESLIEAVRKYGKPDCVRTDNESVFTSRLFRLGLWMLGIRHQRTEIACPWMNGRVERFFGTLKKKLNRWEVASHEELAHSLQLFRFHYNHVRPHDWLDGRTPAEVWSGAKGNPNRAKWFEAWDGLLTGYWLPPP